MKFIYLLLTIIVTSKLLCAQTDTIACVDGESYNIEAGETIICQFDLTGETTNLSVSNSNITIINSNIENNSSKKVTIKINTPGVYSTSFNFERNKNKTITYNITFNVKFPEPTISEAITHSDCSGLTGAIDISVTSPYAGLEVVSQSWTGPNDYTNTLKDINNLIPGTYILTMNYRYNGGTVESVNKTIEVNTQNNLAANISNSQISACAGNQINISTNISGGISHKTYIWIISWGSNTSEITGNENSVQLPPDLLGNKKIKLKVQSGICTKESNEIDLNIHKKIKTNFIRRKK